MDVGIVAQRGNARAAYLAGDLAERLREADVAVRIDESTADTLELEGAPIDAFDACDLIVSIGGDGTFLYAAKGADGTPIVGVNLGEVGFLNAVAPEDAVETVLGLVEIGRETGSVPSVERQRLAASGEDWSLSPALNEIVVAGPQRGHGQGVEIEVRVDGALYTGGRADGVLVATPTGSTAYNLSEGGPLVHPDVAAAVVTEMVGEAPMPPLVVPRDATVTVRVDGAESATVISDGRATRTVEPPTTVTVERAAEPVRVAGPAGEFFEALGKLD